MKALTWQGKRKIAYEDVPDPVIREPGDAIIQITSTAICGSDLHLYELLGPYMNPGDVLGHEPMGTVVQVGSGVERLKVGDRVVVPFNIACGNCWMCDHGLQSQCETTQVVAHGKGAAIYGYSQLYGSVPGGQAEFLRVPFADYGPLVVGKDLPDHRYLFLSDILPTAWQAVEYAAVPERGTVAVYGLGPVGQLCARIATYRGYRVFGIDPVPERRAMAERNGTESMDFTPDALAKIREATGRGPDAVVDAVGMEAHGSPFGTFLQESVGFLPDPVARKAMETVSIDRTAVLHSAVEVVRRGGTISLSGVYAGKATPMPLQDLFDKQVQVRQGQCNVRQWIDRLLPLAEDPSDPLGLDDLVTHTAPLSEGPGLYEMFQKKQEGCIKVVLKP